MISLSDCVAAILVISLVLVPLFALSSANTRRSAFLLERRQAMGMALALIERYRGDGAVELRCHGTWNESKGRWVLADPHLESDFDDDDPVRLLATDRLLGPSAEVETSVMLETRLDGPTGLARLTSTVTVRRRPPKGNALSEATITVARLLPMTP